MFGEYYICNTREDIKEWEWPRNNSVDTDQVKFWFDYQLKQRGPDEVEKAWAYSTHFISHGIGATMRNYINGTNYAFSD